MSEWTLRELSKLRKLLLLHASRGYPIGSEAVAALDAKDAEIARLEMHVTGWKKSAERLTAERDAAISEIGKTARETHTAAWNEAIEAAAKIGASWGGSCAAAIRELRR